MTKEPAGRRTRGRPAGATGARNAVLDAAIRQFADRGYAGASVRVIAAEAGVDPALVRHYFGSKRELFAATVANRLDLVERVFPALDGGVSQAGERLTRAYLALWEEAELRPIFLAIVRSTLTEGPEFADLLADVQARVIAEHGLAERGYRDTGLHAVSAQLLGVALMRYVVQLPPLATMDLEDLVASLAPSIQSQLVGPAQQQP